MTAKLTSKPLLVAPGELRADHLRLFEASADTPVNLVLAAPGTLGTDWPDLRRIADAPHERLSQDVSFSYRRAALAYFTAQIDSLPQTTTWEHAITGWITALCEGSLQVHHDVDNPSFTRLVCTDQESAVRMGPITLVEQAEELDRDLDLVLRGEAHHRARSWLTRRRDRAHDISPAVLAVLEASWAGSLLSPEELYFKILVEYFAITLDSAEQADDDNPLIEVMTEFQRSAYIQAKGILQRYGGVFLADVVGLGKTFIAIALLRHLQDRYRQHAVIVAPPAILPAWRELAAEFRIELQYVSYGKLEDLDQFSDREILVIDESHNFRNPGTQRMDLLSQWLRPRGEAATRKVILVSATPQNNRPRDVYHQLLLFPDTFARLPYEEESLLDYFKAVERRGRSMTGLLQHVVVRRTRRFIQSAYPDAKLRRRIGADEYRSEALVFPTRVSGGGQCLRYAIDTTYPGGLYDEILRTVTELRLPRHNLGAYLRPERRNDPRVDHVVKTPTNLRGLFRVLLLKRVESSIEALRLTLERLAARLRATIAELAEGRVRVTGQPEAASDDDDQDTDDFAPAELFDIGALRAAASSDLTRIDELRQGLVELGPEADSKLRRLREYLDTRPPGAHKVLVFTQFADTAEYLGRNLESYPRRAVATGSRGGALNLARRFSPRSSRTDIDDERELDLLVATDVLSEGVNLQDGDTLINYDIHWNPVRLIQRAGRIDRIGSANAEIHISSFLPERSLEENLGLEERVRARIDDFIRVFGEDYHVLPAEEQLNENAIIDAYTGRALEDADQEDEVMDGLSRHIERLIALRKVDPERFEEIRAMRLGRRAIASGEGPGVAAMRRGWIWRFYTADEGAPLQSCEDCSALDLLYRASATGCDVAPSSTSIEELGRLAEAARSKFTPVADLLEQQRTNPALDPAERWVQTQIDGLRDAAPASKLSEIDRAIDWILRGQHKHRFRPLAKTWRREKRSAAAIVDEMRRLLRSYPIDDAEEASETELVGVLGVDAGTGKPLVEIDHQGEPVPSTSSPVETPTTGPGDGSESDEGRPRSALSSLTPSTIGLLHGAHVEGDDDTVERRRFRWKR